MVKKQHPWLDWAREIQALGQTGIAYSKDEYDRQRYRRLLEIAAEIVAGHTTYAQQAVLADFLLQTGYATPKVDVRGAVDFFPFDALPPLSVNRTNERHLQDIWTCVQNGRQTAVFD
jgi:hypothetical protein